MKPSTDPNKIRDQIMLNLRTRAFLANGGTIEKIPMGVSALSPSMSKDEVKDFTWRNTQRKKAEQ
jgi:hypothetical protein